MTPHLLKFIFVEGAGVILDMVKGKTLEKRRCGVNIFRELFYIGQDKANRVGILFILVGVLITAVSCGLYGFAMGVGTSPTAAMRDAIKLAMIFVIGFLISLLPSLLAFKLTNSGLSIKTIIIGIFSGFLMAGIVLGITAPFSFLYGLIWNIGGRLVHIIIIDIAIIIGLYIMGSIFYNALGKDKQALVLPLILTFLFILLAIYLLAQFFSPYFSDTGYFCEGIRRLQEIFVKRQITV